jgi:hypothetical protein
MSIRIFCSTTYGLSCAYIKSENQTEVFPNFQYAKDQAKWEVDKTNF